MTETPAPSDYDPAPNVDVILPCTQADFGQFISKLLGRPQTTGSLDLCNFDLTRDQIENTYHLIDQRLTQNSGTLVDFTAKIGYSDNSYVEVKSLTEFQSFREVRPVVSSSVTLCWVYLVTFPGAAVPEKQTIEITFSAERQSFNDSMLFARLRNRHAYVQFEIEHTSRSWGSDIESLLNGHIATLTNDETGIRAFICGRSTEIGVSSGLLFISLATLGAVAAANWIADAHISQFPSAVTQATLPSLSQQITELSTIVASGAWHRFNFLQGVYFITSIVVAVVLGSWVSSAADNPQPSFLQLTEQSIKLRTEILDARRRGWWELALSFFVTIVAGVCTRIVFFYISKWWLQ